MILKHPLLTREAFSVIELCTLFPYSLNKKRISLKKSHPLRKVILCDEGQRPKRNKSTVRPGFHTTVRHKRPTQCPRECPYTGHHRRMEALVYGVYGMPTVHVPITTPALSEALSGELTVIWKPGLIVKVSHIFPKYYLLTAYFVCIST